MMLNLQKQENFNSIEQDRYSTFLEAFGHRNGFNPIVTVENVSL